MKNTLCSVCEIRSDLHKALFGVGFINGKCVPCAGETVAFQKGFANRAIQDSAIEASRMASFRKRQAEWSPEIAEAMRIPQ